MKKKKPSLGHAEHTQNAVDTRGLPGEFQRPIKLTMLGAGSAFTPRLAWDLFSIPGLKGGEIALVDIDTKRLNITKKLIEKIRDIHGRLDWKITASTDRLKVLAGTHYIVNCIEVSGVHCVRNENDIPAKYGVDQCIGDTLGPGGLFKGLRTIPVWLQVLEDAERLCPEAIVLNYTNPMSMLCLAAARTSRMSVVGLCHSVQGTADLLAKRAGVSVAEMEWECAGINHLAWFTKLRHKGKDLYPLLKKKAAQDLAGKPSNPDDKMDLVRKDMMLKFGAFITESSGHLSEYLPYYRKNKAALKQYCRSAYHGESSYYATHWPEWRKRNDQLRMDWASGKTPMDWKRSWEYASSIIEAREKDAPVRIHGTVPNTSQGGGPLIANLPVNGCVEVACMIDRNGINATRYGSLPPQMAAISRSNMSFIELAAQAAIERSIGTAIHALLLDPLTSAVCTTDQIEQMTLEIFRAEKKYLPGYKI
jgi:alpha-galactosidase